MRFPITLRLRGVEGVNVVDLSALNAGVSRFVGKPSESVHVPDSLVFASYRKSVLLGELVIGDDETARALGLPFPKQAAKAAPKEV